MIFWLARCYWARKGGVAHEKIDLKPVSLTKKVYCGDCRWFRVNDMSFDYTGDSGHSYHHRHVVNECDHPKNIEKIAYYKDTFLERQEHFKFKDRRTPENRNYFNNCKLWMDKDKDAGDWEL